MYKVFKERGYTDITLRNMETFAEISLGRFSSSIRTLLERDGYSIDNPSETGSKSISTGDRWSIDVSDDIAKDLNNLARKGTRKPIRHQTSKPKTNDIKPGMRVDLFDLIFSDED